MKDTTGVCEAFNHEAPPQTKQQLAGLMMNTGLLVGLRRSFVGYLGDTRIWPGSLIFPPFPSPLAKGWKKDALNDL